MQASLANALAVATAVRTGVPASSDLANGCYGLSVPSYREFLGEHWHTGWYEAQGEIGPHDQLRMQLLVAESAAIGPDSQVLDVGCGVGGPACHLARTTGARMRGLTANAQHLEVARAAAERQGLAGRVRFDLGTAAALPYADASFDAVLFFETPSRFPDRPRFFAEAWRVLRPGGRLAGEDWLACEQATEPLRSEWSRRIGATWSLPPLGTLRSHAQDMAQAGFRVALARDLREEMALLRGFLTDPGARAEILADLEQGSDPIRKLVLEGVLVLGEAAALGAFTIGRFLARKPLEN